jgi:hypothetical protein
MEISIISSYKSFKTPCSQGVFLFHMKEFTLFLFLLLCILGCEKSDLSPEDTFVVLDYPINNLHVESSYQHNTGFGGPIQNTSLIEASGLAVSRNNPQIVWSHNDSGHANRVYAVGINGENFGIFIPEGAGTRDWEDMCIGPGPIEGVNYIYIGDIGDNQAQWNYIVVYRFPEPDISQLDSISFTYIPANQIERMEFFYPDGPRDAETLMIDPWTKDLYIVSKRDFRSIIYKAPYPQSTNTLTELEKIAQLPFNWATAGDISSDGHHIAIKDKNKIYYWKRNSEESVLEALKREPKLLPYILEIQGESFGWTVNGMGYFTLSEQSGGVFMPNLYYYSK